MTSTTCGWCGRLAHMVPVGAAEVLQAAPGVNVGFAAYQCANCRRLLLAHGVTGYQVTTWNSKLQDPFDYEGVGEPNWLPAAGSSKTFPDVPDAISSLAVEAHDCLAINATRGAVALARAVIEASAKDKGVTGGSLVKKIEQLADMGLLRAHIKAAAHEVRFGGNDAAHGDVFQGSTSIEEAEEILTLMDEVLTELYQSPARVARARERRIGRTKTSESPGQST